MKVLSALTALLIPTAGFAQEACDIIDDTITAIEKREASIPLLDYKNVGIRAVDGKIRCEDSAADNRLVCMVEGKGEIVVVPPDRPMMVIAFNTDELGEAHVYEGGDVSCALKSEFDKYR